MNRDDLFLKKGAVSKPEPSKDLILLSNLLMNRPLNYFESNKWRLKKASSGDRLQAAQYEFADAVFISSLDFAQIKKGWQVIPNVCLASNGHAPVALLTYPSEDADLSTIAKYVNEPTIEAALRIIIREKYEIEVSFYEETAVPSAKSVCKLLIDSDALKYAHQSEKYIDIAEEWFDLTGLPFVYGFWIVHETNLSLTTEQFELAHRNFLKNIELAFGDIPPGTFLDFVVDKVCSKMLFQFGEDEKESLAEFYDYAFMYGLIEYNPKFDFR